MAKKNAVRKIFVSPKKESKSVFVVADTPRMRPLMEGVRSLGYECTLSETVGELMTLLRDGERINVLIIDLKSAKSAEKLILWMREKRPGVRIVCIVGDSLAGFGPTAVALGATVVDESDLAKMPEILRDLINQQAR